MATAGSRILAPLVKPEAAAWLLIARGTWPPATCASSTVAQAGVATNVGAGAGVQVQQPFFKMCEATLDAAFPVRVQAVSHVVGDKGLAIPSGAAPSGAADHRIWNSSR